MGKFNFAKTEAAAPSTFLQPGIHTVKITEVKLGLSKEKKTPFLGVKFTTAEDLSIVENFFLSESALGRLQYLHEAWVGKKCAKEFNSEEEVEAYFRKTFVNKAAGTRNIIVGGEVADNGKIYGQLPFTGFITDEGEGLFENGDENWKRYVVKSNRTTAASGKKNGILNETDDSEAKGSKGASTKKGATTEPEEEGGDDDTPW